MKPYESFCKEKNKPFNNPILMRDLKRLSKGVYESIGSVTIWAICAVIAFCGIAVVYGIERIK